LNISEKQKKPSASEDLTVVLLRGNGSPRSFRISLPALYRSLTALGFAFAFLLAASLVLLSLTFWGPSQPTNTAPAAAEVPAPPAAPQNYVEVIPAEAPPAPGIWSKLTAPSIPAGNESEAAKELVGLREDIARLNAQLDGRKDLPAPATSTILQLLGPRSTMVPEADSLIRIRNANTSRDPATKQVLLDFELHNVDAGQRQVRGYIVAIAKTPDLLISYPGNLFAPGQNILLDHTKGETFAISRFRQARATFPLGPLEERKVSYQILLFGTDGQVIANAHVEETR
jgi:hypothetical protein